MLLIAVLIAATVAVAPYADALPTASGTVRPVIPFAGLSSDIADVDANLDAATRNALATEARIEELEAENDALIERIDVAEQRVAAQRTLVNEARDDVATAQQDLNAHVVAMYKRGNLGLLGILLTSEDIAEFVSRTAIISRIVYKDEAVITDLRRALANAQYEEATLTSFLAQGSQLADEQTTRLLELEQLLVEQQQRVSTLTAQSREVLLQARRLNAQTRAQWRAASIPIGTTIPRSTATVDSSPGVTFAISAYMPRQYTSTGERFSAVCSWYGPGFNGRPTASGQLFNQDDYTCASKTLPFGTVLALTRGNRRVIVYVNDRGPYSESRDLDLSKAAAITLGFSGVQRVTAEIVTPVL